MAVSEKSEKFSKFVFNKKLHFFSLQTGLGDEHFHREQSRSMSLKVVVVVLVLVVGTHSKKNQAYYRNMVVHLVPESTVNTVNRTKNRTL